VTADRYLGLDTGGTGIKWVVTDPELAVLASGEVPTDRDHITVSLARVATAVVPELGVEADLPRLAGMGMAVAGIVDHEAGRLGRSPNLPGWEDKNLRKAAQDVFGPVPTAFANDVNAALFGEYARGAGRGCGDLVMIALGTGAGGGVMVDGRLVTGVHHGAGEIGHTVLEIDGPECTCGGRGCLESWAGRVAIMNRARARAADGAAGLAAALAEHGEGWNPRDLAELAHAGDEDAREIFGEAGRRLGQAVGNLVNILDPGRVIIGGGLARAGDLILGPCRAMVPGLVLAAEAKKVPIVEAELGHLAAAVGAACLAEEAGRGD
jgi:glucokinase